MGACSPTKSKPRPPRQVMFEDGDYARAPGQAAGRWARHFAAVHSGKVLDQDEHFAMVRPKAYKPVAGMAAE
eukprot:2955158-Alexandrium_andersonii.AAC.1